MHVIDASQWIAKRSSRDDQYLWTVQNRVYTVPLLHRPIKSSKPGCPYLIIDLFSPPPTISSPHERTCNPTHTGECRDIDIRQACTDRRRQVLRAFTANSIVRMAPITKPNHDQYDIVFIGGGSGGVAGSVSGCVVVFGTDVLDTVYNVVSAVRLRMVQRWPSSRLRPSSEALASTSVSILILVPPELVIRSP